MKFAKRIAAVLLAFSMMLSMAACADTTWALKYGDKTISSGLYLSFLMNAYSEAGTKVADTAKDIFSQKIEEKDAKTWIVEKAETLASQFVAIENKFTEYGLSLTESDQNEIKQSMKSEWPQVSAIYEKNGVGEASYKTFVENRKKTARLFEYYYSKEGVEPISDADLMVHYKDNYANINALGISKAMVLEDEGKADVDKQNEELLKLANEYAESINSKAKTFGEVSDEYKHYSAQTEHDKENTTDTIQKDEDLRRLIKKDDANLGEELSKAIFEDMKPDSKAFVTSDDTAYYVLVRYELENNTEAEFTEMRTGVLADLKQEDFIKITEQWGTDTKPSDKNNSAINRYNPKKIDLKQA